jgi:hypothetical protein
MHTRTTTTALLLTAGLTLTGCGSHTDSPAQKLADSDGGAHRASAYQQLLDQWATKCTEDTASLAGYVDASVGDLLKNGIASETRYTVLQQLNQSTPDGAPTNCEDITASYLTLREQRP